MLRCSTAGTSARQVRHCNAAGFLLCPIWVDLVRSAAVNSSAAADTKGEAMGVTVQDAAARCCRPAAHDLGAAAQKTARRHAGAGGARGRAAAVLGSLGGAVASRRVFHGFSQMGRLLPGFILGTPAVLLPGRLVSVLAGPQRRRPALARLCHRHARHRAVDWLLVVPNPFGPRPCRRRCNLRDGSFDYPADLRLPWRVDAVAAVPLWLGIAAAISWSAAVRLGDQRSRARSFLWRGWTLPAAERLQLYLDPNFVDLIAQSANVVLILIITGILAIVVSRSRRARRRLHHRRARADQPGATFFAQSGRRAGLRRRAVRTGAAPGRRHPIRRYRRLHHLFGGPPGRGRCSSFCGSSTGAWSRWCSTMAAPSTTTSATASWRHSACRSRPKTTPLRALAARSAMIGVLKQWNARRVAAGEPPVDVRIGAQYGP